MNTAWGISLERLQDMSEADRDAIWVVIKKWIAADPPDEARHTLRERIRKFAFTRYARINGITSIVKDHAREVYELLAPRDLIVRHLWLFAQHWVDESADELDEQDFDFEKREARVASLRKAALTEIWETSHYDGIMRLCTLGDASSIVGWQLADDIIPTVERAPFLERLTAQGTPPSQQKVDNLLAGFLARLDMEDRRKLTGTMLKSFVMADTADKAIRLLGCSPFRATTWTHLDSLPEEWQRRYWRETYVHWEHQDEAEINMLVTRLLEARRPRAAFNCVHLDFGQIETMRLMELLKEVATSTTEPAGQFQFAQYEISSAFQSLQKRSGVSPIELASLEFMYVSALEHSEYGILDTRNLR